MPGETRTLARRYYQIAGITIQVESDVPITNTTFHPKFKPFEADGPGEDTITIRHHFSMPDLNGRDMGEAVYRKPPWAVYRKGNYWIYVGISGDRFRAITGLWPQVRSRWRSFLGRSRQHEERVEKACSCPAKQWHTNLLAVFNHDHTRVRIYMESETLFRRGNLSSLTLFPTDQILLARVLAQRKGCFFHAGGVALDGKGFLFVGHSGAGKTTIVNMMKPMAEVLCDDRIIVRRWPDGFRAHGNWSHGDVEDVSAGSAPLKAILFLEQAQENRLISIDEKQEIIRRLLACLIKPLVTADWWDRMLTLVATMAREVPCYSLRFDKGGGAVTLLRDL